MGYKNKAKQINKEKKENREPIVRSEQGVEWSGQHTHRNQTRQNEITYSNKVINESKRENFTLEEVDEINDSLPKKGWRLVKKVKK